MHHSLAEAKPAAPHVVRDGGRHITALEISTLTAAVVEVWRHDDGRCGARLNAFVDGLGHRIVHVELSPHDHAQAGMSLCRTGVLVRCSGVLVGGNPCQCILTDHGLELLIPEHGG